MDDHESITVRFIEITGLTRSEAIEFLDVGNVYDVVSIFSYHMSSLYLFCSVVILQMAAFLDYCSVE